MHQEKQLGALFCLKRIVNFSRDVSERNTNLYIFEVKMDQWTSFESNYQHVKASKKA